MIRRLIILLLIVGCDTTEPENIEPDNNINIIGTWHPFLSILHFSSSECSTVPSNKDTTNVNISNYNLSECSDDWHYYNFNQNNSFEFVACDDWYGTIETISGTWSIVNDTLHFIPVNCVTNGEGECRSESLEFIEISNVYSINNDILRLEFPVPPMIIECYAQEIINGEDVIYGGTKYMTIDYMKIP
tara:strand:- start:27 stop:590 length:564 start_codon:yes stop_codon:yes gene_type:complete